MSLGNKKLIKISPMVSVLCLNVVSLKTQVFFVFVHLWKTEEFHKSMEFLN